MFIPTGIFAGPPYVANWQYRKWLRWVYIKVFIWHFQKEKSTVVVCAELYYRFCRKKYNKQVIRFFINLALNELLLNLIRNYILFTIILMQPKGIKSLDTSIKQCAKKMFKIMFIFLSQKVGKPMLGTEAYTKKAQRWTQTSMMRNLSVLKERVK